MPKQRVLIVFESSEGQTEKIARRIGAELADGLEVAVEPASSAPPPDGFDGVVAGGSIHVGRYGKALVEYLEANAGALNAMPAALFQVSMTSADDDEEHTRTAQGLVHDLLDKTGFKPDLVAMFAGAVVYTKYGWIKRRIMKAIAASEGRDTDTAHDHEYTDWQAVEHFAADVGDLVRSMASTTS